MALKALRRLSLKTQVIEFFVPSIGHQNYMNKFLPLSLMIIKIFSLLFSYFPNKLNASLYIALWYRYFILQIGKIFHFLKSHT